MSDTVRYEVGDHVAVVTLHRPERLNAMTTELLQALLGSLESAAIDNDVRAVIVTGAGRAFCAGGDVTGLAGGGEREPGNVREAMRGGFRVVELLREMPKVTIAAINGPCAGAGFAIACACDLRYAARSAIFNSAFVAVGSSGDYGGAWTLPRIVGEAKAREIYLLSERFDAATAERIGLVANVFDDVDLMVRARAAAERAANFAPLTVAAIKESFNDSAGEPSFSAYLDREADRFTRVLGTRDATEAARAFLEKRSPRFEGR